MSRTRYRDGHLFIMPIIVLSKVSETRMHLSARRQEKPRNVVLVPTMGALHEGHAQLIRQARELAGDEGTVVVSIFVNSTQFGPNEDLDRYPRSLDRDSEVCQDCGADLIFAPGSADMYAPDHSFDVRETGLSMGLCGASRSGHFPGVCLVVLKLFNIVHPTHAVFGKKDYQQLAVIRRLVRDLNVPVEIVGGETVREEDGLAMSSRNANLTDAERRDAPGIQEALQAGRARWEKLPDIAPGLLIRLVRSRLEQISSGQIDYLELVDGETLHSVHGVIEKPVVMATAMFFSKARLIDNIEFGPKAQTG
ncbi:pantoate--beta-alanine ligase [Verrucomicrobiales bacterium]|nr:pantoate--beta-alanine ligase [Verrucomicrobiales bacterium]MDC0503026.1 pantoate--beta-alanine ligase [Verrucomicrobiales bacterium]MDF1788188.1 pantoate--beta-alanine ligase [Verrucomicrobiales bacterium]